MSKSSNRSSRRGGGGGGFHTLPSGACTVDGSNGEVFQLSKTQCAAFPAGQFLGQGSFASTYAHKNDPTKVVKFTSDALDADSAVYLIGKKLKGATEVYDVAELVGHQSSEGEPIHAIIAERVKPLSRPDDNKEIALIQAFDEPMSFYAQEKFSYAKPPNLKSAKLGPKFTLPKKLKDSMHGVCSRYERFNPGKQDCTRMDELIDAVEDTAQKAGILTGDLHEGNWGKRPDGSLVILDFGQSKQKDKRPAIRQLAGLGKDIAVLLGVAALAAGAVWLFKKRSE